MTTRTVFVSVISILKLARGKAKCPTPRTKVLLKSLYNTHILPYMEGWCMQLIGRYKVVQLIGYN